MTDAIITKVQLNKDDIKRILANGQYVLIDMEYPSPDFPTLFESSTFKANHTVMSVMYDKNTENWSVEEHSVCLKNTYSEDEIIRNRTIPKFNTIDGIDFHVIILDKARSITECDVFSVKVPKRNYYHSERLVKTNF